MESCKARAARALQDSIAEQARLSAK